MEPGASENKKVLRDERSEKRGERKVIYREVYTQYCRYNPKM
jgi:hypothetical protein